MIVSILTDVGMAIEVLIESLSGRPTVSTTTSGNTSGGDGKGSGAGEWMQNKTYQINWKTKALEALPGIIGLIL